MNSERKKILIIKLGAIGDVVMSLPMLEAVREKYGNAGVTWMTGKAPLPILKSAAGISELITVDDTAILTGSLPAKLKELFRIWIMLLFRKFDLVVIPYRDKRYKLLALTVRASKCRHFMGPERENTLVPGRYHASEYRKLIDGIDDREMKDPVFPKINAGRSSNIDSLLSGTGSRRAVLAPGGSKNILADDILRRWPIENYRLLAEKLIAEGFEVILIGGPTDGWVENEFKGLKVLSLIGKTTLTELIYLFNLCSVFVTHDTGTLQIAKLSDIKAIGLFGPVNPAERTGEKENIRTIWGGEKLPCSPCYDGKRFAGCGNNICMKNITPADVIQIIKQTGAYGI